MVAAHEYARLRLPAHETVGQHVDALGEIRMDKLASRIASLPMDLTRHELLYLQRLATGPRLTNPM